jgi:DNA repair and recombination RAD54-like protein
MADHAIVLYDPTIDDRPDPSKVDEAQLEEERRKKEEEARGPHKSLKAILGIVDVKKKEEVKVPVVIDPRLAKILRPHQIEGMKVSTSGRPWLTVVPVPLHNRVDGGQCVGMHHGGRDGSG